MRIGDVASITWDNISTTGWIAFYDEKINKEWVCEQLAPYVEQWRKYIHTSKQSWYNNTQRMFPGGKTTIARAFEQVMDSTVPQGVTWHPWKRMAAAAFIILGGTITKLVQWMRWHSPAQARWYAKQPPSWQLNINIHLPTSHEYTGN